MGRAAEPSHFGVLLLDKPKGPTSHDLVAWVRWALRERSVGHCGTLDPAATGLMVVCVGAATKLVEYLTGVDKRYRARFVLGRSTTTADAEGQTLAEAPVSDEVLARVECSLAAMVGSLELAPPAYSAIKIDGQRAHALARAGDAPELPRRAMALHRVELLAVGRGEGPELSEPHEHAFVDAIVDVAKGTYVRSLAEELGRRVGVPAHLGALERLACGGLDLEHPLAVRQLKARVLEDEAPSAHTDRPPRWRIEIPFGLHELPLEREATGAWLRDRLIAPWTCLPFESLVVERPDARTEALLARLRHGQRLSLDPGALAGLAPLASGDGLCAIVEPAGHLLIAERDQGRLAPVRRISFELDAQRTSRELRDG